MMLPSKKKVEIIKSLAPRWKLFGIYFDFDETGKTLDIIDAQFQNIETCCQEMLKYWLRGQSKVSVTWSGLLSVLEDCNEHCLCQDVKNAVENLASCS